MNLTTEQLDGATFERICGDWECFSRIDADNVPQLIAEVKRLRIIEQRAAAETQAAISYMREQIVAHLDCRIADGVSIQKAISEIEELPIPDDALAAYVKPLLDAFRRMSETIHNGQYHQWSDWNKCDHPDCMADRALLARHGKGKS